MTTCYFYYSSTVRLHSSTTNSLLLGHLAREACAPSHLSSLCGCTAPVQPFLASHNSGACSRPACRPTSMDDAGHMGSAQPCSARPHTPERLRSRPSAMPQIFRRPRPGQSVSLESRCWSRSPVRSRPPPILSTLATPCTWAPYSLPCHFLSQERCAGPSIPVVGLSQAD